MTITKRTSVALLIALAMLSAPVVAEAGLEVPVTGTIANGSAVGTFNLQRFEVKNGAVHAVGMVTGTFTQNDQTTSFAQSVSAPVATQATCDILHLDIGPINLDLLGLVVDLSPVVLDITAEQGPGNLLGNLLCAITGLLDNPGLLARVLNQVLAIITG